MLSVLVVAGAGIAFLVLGGGASESERARVAMPSGDRSSTTSTTIDSKAVAEAARLAELRNVVGRIDAVLTQSAQGRREVVDTVDRVHNCVLPGYDGMERMNGIIIPNRENVLGGVDAIQTTDLQASQLKDLLRKALGFSIDSNRYYALWMEDVSSDYYEACVYSSVTPSTANLEEASRISGEATAAKIAFKDAYNPVAMQFGLKADWTERDF